MTEKRLDYDRSIVPQETGWWCGPAATQILLNARGIKIPESQIAAEIEQIENPGRGDDRDGTDYVGLIEKFLHRKVPEARYKSVYMPDDPPTVAQKEALWRNIKKSIDAGWGVVANIVAPPRNPPAATKGSVAPPYPKYMTTYHYVLIAGYDDNVSARANWVADSANFGGVTGWWCPFDGKGSICSLIPPKGYAYADVGVAVPTPAPPGQATPGDGMYESASIYRRAGEPHYSLAQMIVSIDGMRHRETVEDAARFGDLDAIDRIARVAAGQGVITDEWAVAHARAVLESIPPHHLDRYLKGKG